MGGSRNINLSGKRVINADIYAPESALVTSATLTVAGSIFVNSFNPSNTVTIHHDIAVLAADSCTPDVWRGGAGQPRRSCSGDYQDCGRSGVRQRDVRKFRTMNSDCAPLSS